MKPAYLKDKQALLLDMNSTFMFGEDRFGDEEDFPRVYRKLGGSLSGPQVNQLIRESYRHLEQCYPLPEYRDAFPTLAQTIRQLAGGYLSETEIGYLVETFAHHERGHIPPDYVDALRQLGESYRLGLVIDIWAPKDLWVSYFQELGIFDGFEAISFSSDCGCVKPSPRGFLHVLQTMKLASYEAIVIGDSIRRDLGGAMTAGIESVLVGGAQSKDALAAYPNLLALCKEWR